MEGSFETFVGIGMDGLFFPLCQELEIQLSEAQIAELDELLKEANRDGRLVPGSQLQELGIHNITGRKYFRRVAGFVEGQVDIYSVLVTFKVDCPATSHAVKKLLCAGQRGKASRVQDLREAIDAILRAIQLEDER